MVMLVVASNDNFGEPGVGTINGEQKLVVAWENPPGDVENNEFSALCSLVISAAQEQGRKEEAEALPLIIGLTGTIGSGKSTVAALLSMVGYEEVNFADALKSEVYAAAKAKAPVPAALSGNREFLEAWLLLWDRPQSVFEKPTLPYARTVLQLWGTEYRRAENVNYWVNQLAEKLYPAHKYVIGDLRFPNEAAMVAERHGLVWKVQRGPRTTPKHSSEELAFLPDYTIDNNKTIKELAAAVRAGLAEAAETLDFMRGADGIVQ